ncbi:MAG: ABC transporter substrate-binding protein [Actinobacteria bacterium]|nr:ABC transporter substrate-binding protein [Actinomycetota bacterium]
MDRRTFLKTSGGLALGATAASLLAACGSSEAPATAAAGGTAAANGPKRKVTLGFISLTDNAPLVIAKEKGFFDQYGLDVTLENGKSWPGVRDKLLNGEFDGAHALFSLPFSVATGVSKIEGDQAKAKSLRVAMMLNQNGQAITLANDLSAAGYNDLPAAKETILGKGAKTFGQTFPGGTHDTWLRYWLKAAGIDWKANGIDLKAIPPPEMFNNLNQENVRGYCVGEPWNARAVAKDKGFTTIATQDLWLNHPEKALVVNEKFATENKDVLKDVMKAIFEAQKWLDDQANVTETAKIIGVEKYVNATPAEIEGRLKGEYDLGAGLGNKTFNGNQMRFFRDGDVPFPAKAYAVWFMAQFVRFGHLTELPPAKQLADQIILSDLYAEVASSMGVKVPDTDMKPFEIMLDKVTFDPAKPEEEAKRP